MNNAWLLGRNKTTGEWWVLGTHQNIIAFDAGQILIPSGILLLDGAAPVLSGVVDAKEIPSGLITLEGRIPDISVTVVPIVRITISSGLLELVGEVPQPLSMASEPVYIDIPAGLFEVVGEILFPHVYRPYRAYRYFRSRITKHVFGQSKITKVFVVKSKIEKKIFYTTEINLR